MESGFELPSKKVKKIIRYEGVLELALIRLVEIIGEASESSTHPIAWNE